MPLGFSPLTAASIGAAGSSPLLPPAATTVPVTGAQAAGAIGVPVIRAKARVTLGTINTVSAKAYLGVPTSSGRAGVTAGGVQGRGVLGVLDGVSAGPNVNIFLFSNGASFQATGVVGDANAVVATDNIYHAVAGVHAAGAIGTVQIVGATSLYPIEIDGVEAISSIGEVGTIQNVNVLVSVPEAVMGSIFDVHALPSSFGTNLTNVQASAWTPIKPI